MISVILISIEGHKFKFETKSKSREIAIEKAFKKINELNYDSYGYTLYSTREI